MKLRINYGVLGAIFLFLFLLNMMLKTSLGEAMLLGFVVGLALNASGVELYTWEKRD
jgi:hypothetical protein